MNNNNTIFYEKKCANQVSWKQRLSKYYYTLTAEDIRNKNNLSNAIHQTNANQDTIKKAIMLSMISEALESSDSSSDDLDSASSASNSSSDDSSASSSDNDDDDNTYMDMLFVLAIHLNKSTTELRNLGNQFLNQFGIEQGEWDPVQQNPAPMKRCLQDWNNLECKTYCTFEYEELEILFGYFFEEVPDVVKIKGHKMRKSFLS